MNNIHKKLNHDTSEDIDLDLLIAVVNEILEDSNHHDYTAIEELFKYLDDPVYRLKGFLRDDT